MITSHVGSCARHQFRTRLERPSPTNRVHRWRIVGRPLDIGVRCLHPRTIWRSSAEGEVGCTGGAVVPLKCLISLVTERPGDPRRHKTSTLVVARDSRVRVRLRPPEGSSYGPLDCGHALLLTPTPRSPVNRGWMTSGGGSRRYATNPGF